MAAAAKKTNWFAVGVSIAVVVVLVALGGLVVFLNNQATAPGAAPSSSIIDEETGAISFGSGDEEVATYVDFMCPACGSFEQRFGEGLQTAAANGDITLQVHPIAILNHLSGGTDFSSRSASAMYCVAESAPDAALDFFNMMFANQPQEGGSGLADEQIVGFAEEVGAGDAASCIADGTYMKFVDSLTPKTPAGPRGISTPTLTINGELIDNPNGSDVLPKLLAGFED